MESIIVGFKGSMNCTFIQANGGIIRNYFEDISAVAASVPKPAIDVLRSNPNVAYVENDSLINTCTPHQPPESLTWGVEKIEAPVVWASGDRGTGIKVAVLDTGIDPNHPDLHVAGGVNFVPGVTSWDDDEGHGTRCAGIIASLDNDIGCVGVAPEAELYAVKVLDLHGRGNASSLIAGIEWCIDNEMQVISMSLGTWIDSFALQAICEKAYNSGIVLVAAAGNYGPDDYTIAWPGRYSSVIAVGATDSNDTVASFSSRGTQLSVAAPGVTIFSTFPGGFYAYGSGTSFSCPHVAGTVALMLANRICTPLEVKMRLQETAVDIGLVGKDMISGYGRINASAAVEAIKLKPPQPDFVMEINQTTLSLEAGSNASFPVELTSLNGFHGTISMNTVLPNWFTGTVTFSPSSVFIDTASSNISTVSVRIPITEPKGGLYLTISAYSGSISHQTTVLTHIEYPSSSPPFQPPQPDWSLSASPITVNVVAGSYGTFSLKTASIDGFHDTVSLGSTALSGWIISYSPAKLTINPGGYSYSTMYVIVPTTASGGTYNIEVTGNTLGHSKQVDVQVNVQPIKVPKAPSTPLNLAATAGNSQNSLSWFAPPTDSYPSITNYRVYRRTASGTEILLMTVGNVLSYTDTSVTNGQTYYYRVTAVNSVGESPKSNEASATPGGLATVPSAPLNLQATPGNLRVTISWSKPSSDGNSPITHYRVYRRTGSGTETLVAFGEAQSYTDTEVISGQTYYYRVTAVNSIGESPKSNEASATPRDPNTKIITLTISPNKPSISRSEYCVVTITVKDATDGRLLRGVAVSITLYEPNGVSGGTSRFITDSSGTARAGIGFSSTVPQGTYKLAAVASLTGYPTANGEAYFALV